MTMTKTKKSTSLAKRPKNTLAKKPKGEVRAEVASTKDKEVEQAKAKIFLSPSASAAVASSGYLKAFGEQDISALMHTLAASMQRVNDGDLKEAESMLIGQAYALQAIFTHLANRSAQITGMKQYEVDLRLALKAQAQCCRTLETLAAMKNPPIVFARQANVTTGPQQINNGTLAPPGPVPACEENKPRPNELMENGYDERMDARTKSKAS